MADPRWRIQDCAQQFPILNFITSYNFTNIIDILRISAVK